MKKIVLDAGHGGHDTGATGNGIVEKDLALNITKQVRDVLKANYEVDVLLTREDDTFIKLSDRAKFANDRGADYFVSFHHNAAGGQGFETYVYLKTQGGETGRLQKVIHQEIMNYLNNHGVKDRGQREANFAVVRETRMPAILIENLFVDHPKDAKLLKNDKFIAGLTDSTAHAIAKALALPRKQTVSKSESGTGASASLPQINGKATVQFGDKKAHAYIINGAVYAPVRFVASTAGYSIDWDNEKKVVTIRKS